MQRVSLKNKGSHTKQRRFPHLMRVLVLWSGVACLPATAEPAEPDDKTPPHVMRILTVGNRLPFRQEIRDGIRYELTPPEGSLPPSEVRVGFESNNEEQNAKSSARMRLGEVSPPLKFPVPESGSIQIRDSDNQGWLKANISPKGASLVVVWKTGEKWNEVASVTLDDSSTAIPEKAVRIVNASHLQIGVVFGKSRYRLLPATSHVLTMEPSATAAKMEILYAEPGSKAESLKAVLRTTVTNETGIRRQWIIHRSDQPGARHPLGIIPVFEPRQPMQTSSR